MISNRGNGKDSPRCTLVILFNHPYPQNIEKLRAIYSSRFSDIVFLMPIIRIEDDPAVITVYRGSFNFHGHIADALAALEARESDLYLFCQDDLLLNPELTPASFWDGADFDQHDGFIPEPESFSGPGREDWYWNDRVLSRLTEPLSMLYGGGVETFTRYLPSVEETRAKFSRLGIEASRCPKSWPPLPNRKRVFRRSEAPKGPVGQLPYPLAVAFSDFFSVRRDALRPVVQYLGLFAAMDLFAEVSVATSMILGCRNLTTLRDTSWRVHIDWTDRGELALDAPATLAATYQKFDTHLLYRHPVKLSTISMVAEAKNEEESRAI